MKISKTLFLSLLIFVASSSLAFGYYYGSSNFGYSGYPKFSQKSYPPSPPYSKDQWAISRYRSDVEQYQTDGRNYTQAARNDIRQIEQAIRQAESDVNQVVNSYNSRMRGGY